MQINKELKNIIDLIYETFNLPVAYFRSDNSKCIYERELAIKSLSNFNSNKKCIYDVMSEKNIKSPKIILTPYYENYIGIDINGLGEERGILIIGPSLYKSINENAINALFSSISLQKREELKTYYKSLPTIAFDKLNNIARMAYYIIYKEYISIDEIIEENFYDINMMAAARGRFSREFSRARQEKEVHHTYEQEKILFDCIKRGDTKSLLYNLNIPLEGKTGILAEGNPLRSEKNLVISMAAVAARVIIEEGVPAGLAYGVNDSYAQLIEKGETIEQVKSLMITMLCDFANLVKETKTTQYSKIVRSCWDYIYVNLYEKITVEDISQVLNCNTNYLSRLFKKEVGKSISEFITYERIEEAKKLLKYTKLSIIDIADFLQFHDQSHFTRVFKKLTGVTPKKYRSQY